MDLGNLIHLPMKHVWAKEASDFTPWLAQHLDQLGAALGMDLELVEREAAVGSFSVDLLARDLGSNRLVVIENQFGPTNHDHLGKVLTYAAGYDACTAVWIAEEFRDEHRQALDWLNSRTTKEVNFVGVVVDVLRIDESRPAVQFRLVAEPNEWQKEQATQTPASPKGELYRQFFQPVIDALRTKHFTGMRKAPPQNWIAFSSGRQGVSYNVDFASGNRVRVELYMDSDPELFQVLVAAKEQIEGELGEALSWEPLEDKQASRVAVYRDGHIYADAATLQDISEWVVDQMVRFRTVFAPRLTTRKT